MGLRPIPGVARRIAPDPNEKAPGGAFSLSDTESLSQSVFQILRMIPEKAFLRQ
jgi:hypothetical protein